MSSTEVIVLNDSSDEEEEEDRKMPAVPTVTTTSVHHHPAAARVSLDSTASSSAPSKKVAAAASSDIDMVDLCSDNEDTKNTTDNGFDSADLELAKRQSLLGLEEKKNRRVSLSQSSSNRNRNIYQQQSSIFDSDSDDDDLLATTVPFASKKKASTTSQQHQPTASNPSRASLSTSTTNPVVVNPYAKKKSTGTPKSTTPKDVANNSITTSTTRMSPIVPIQNPYAKSSPSATTSTTNNTNNSNDADEFPYPTLLSGSKQYEDKRARYLLAFWKCARSLTVKSYDAQKLQQTVNDVVALALWPHPLRSLEEYLTRNKTSTVSIAMAKTQLDAKRALLDKGGEDKINVPVNFSGCDGKYCSIVEACLVAMHDMTKQRATELNRQHETDLASKEMLISLQDLIPEINKRLHSICPGKMKYDAEYYTNKSNRSAEYMQIQKLKIECTDDGANNEAYIKERTRHKQVVFELKPLGYRTAQWIRSRVFPAPPGHYRTSRISTLTEVQPEYKDICLAMDFNEGGANKVCTQQDMCNCLDWKKVPYFVGKLDIGDYAFFSTKPGQENLLCPILVERKSIQDAAGTIAGPRWKNQKKKMYRGQYVFGHDNCRIAYLIEGKIEKEIVRGGFVGNIRDRVTLEQFNEEIANLEEEGFDIIRTTHRKDSMFQLTRWAAKVANEVRSGSLKLEYTYEQFKAKVNAIPKGTDFSRLAKDARKTRLEKEQLAAQAAAKPGAAAANPQETTVVETATKKPEARAPQQASAKSKPVEMPHQDNGSLIDLCDGDGEEEEEENRNDTAGLNESDSSDTDDEDELHSRVRKTIAEVQKRKRKEEKKGKNRALQKQQKRSKKENGSKPEVRALPQQRNEVNNEVDSQDQMPGSEYDGLSKSELEKRCVEYGLPKSGSKGELIARLQGPKPPPLWLQRKAAGQYVPPRHNVASTALLVALYLHEREQTNPDAMQGMAKEELYAQAEGLDITKNPFSGGTTQTGPYHYDGWSSMEVLLKGDPPLVSRLKGRRYKLTRNSHLAGFEFAKAMHQWCHAHGICPCGREDH